MQLLRPARLAVSLICALVAGFSSAARADTSPCDAVVNSLHGLESYHMVVTTTVNGRTSVMTGDVQKPNRMHGVSSGMEMIVIGNKAWTRTPGSGPYKAFPMKMDMSSFLSMDPTKFTGSKILTCSQTVGLWHGQPAKVYKMTSTSDLGPASSTAYVLADGYMHHSDGRSSHGTVSLDLSNFNGVSISPP